MEKYDQAIPEQLQSEITQRVIVTGKSGGIIHYSPQRPVVMPQKYTTKLRILFDSSMKYKKGLQSQRIDLERSLDDKGSLRNFTAVPICENCLNGRCRKTFHQIGLNEPDRSSIRFLWLKDCKKDAPKENIVTYNFKRILFGMNASPFC